MVQKPRYNSEPLQAQIKRCYVTDRQALELTKLARMKLGRHFNFSRDIVLTVFDGVMEKILAGFVFYDIKHGDAKIMMWADSPIWRHFIDEIEAHAWKKYDRLTAEIPESNRKALALAEKVGFVFEGTLRKYARGENVLIYGALKNG